MENFDDKFGDLSGYKILSFEEVSKGFEGNKNPLQGLKNKSFEEKSNEYALQSLLGEKSLFYKKIVSNIVYNIGTNPLWKYRIENSTKGTELIDNYTKYDETIDSSKGKYDKDTDFIIYIEEQNNINGLNVDLNSVCLIKMSQAMLNEYFAIIKVNPTSNILEQWSSIIIAQQKNVNNLNFTSEKLVEAFKLEIIYRPLKIFDIGSKKHTKTDITDGILSGISIAFRQLKFEQQSWDPALKSSDYLLEKPKEVIIFIKNKIIGSISLLKEIENFLLAVEYLLLTDQTFINTVKLFISNLKKDLFLVEKYLDSAYLSSPYHFAFLCGLWDGIVEFVAGFLDIILLAFNFYFQLDELDAEDKITSLKLKEGIEEFIENYLKYPDFLKKSIGEAIGNYFEERYSENQNGYVISHNAGEDFIIAIDIIFSIVEVIKSIADVGKILPKMEHWVDDALKRNPNLESKLDDIHKPKELPEESIREKQIEEVVVESKKKPTPKERLDKLKNKRDVKIDEKYQKIITERRKTFRKTNRHIKKIEGELSATRDIYYKQRVGLDQGKIKNHWYHGVLANRIKKVEMTLEDAKVFARAKQSIGKVTNIARGEMEIGYNGKKVFAKDDYWANASKQNLMKSGIDISPEKYNAKQFMDPEVLKDESGKILKVRNRVRLHDSEVKITSLMDEDIARTATELKVDPKVLEIRSKIYTTYDPCNVCKREILTRARIYPKANFEIIRPVLRNSISGKIEPVKGNDEFIKFMKQNNLQ